MGLGEAGGELAVLRCGDEKRGGREVEQAVRWMKYHPEGECGMYLGNHEAEYGTKPAPEHVAEQSSSQLRPEKPASHSHWEWRTPFSRFFVRSARLVFLSNLIVIF